MASRFSFTPSEVHKGDSDVHMFLRSYGGVQWTQPSVLVVAKPEESTAPREIGLQGRRTERHGRYKRMIYLQSLAVRPMNTTHNIPTSIYFCPSLR